MVTCTEASHGYYTSNEWLKRLHYIVIMLSRPFLVDSKKCVIFDFLSLEIFSSKYSVFLLPFREKIISNEVMRISKNRFLAKNFF